MEGGGGDRSDFVSPSEVFFFYYYFKGENKKSEGGGGLESDEAVASTNRPRTSGQSHRFLFAKSAEKAPYNLSQSMYSGIKWLLWVFLTKGWS